MRLKERTEICVLEDEGQGGVLERTRKEGVMKREKDDDKLVPGEEGQVLGGERQSGMLENKRKCPVLRSEGGW